MKKLFGMIIVVAALVMLVTILPAFASNEIINVDWVKCTNAEGGDVAVLAPANAVPDFGTLPPGAILGNLRDEVAAGATDFNIVAWYMPWKPMADIGLRIDGGAISYDGYGFFNQDLADAIVSLAMADATQAGYTFRIDFSTPILEGNHLMELIAKFTDGEEKIIYQMYYSNSVDVALGKPVSATIRAVPTGGALVSDNVFWNPAFAVDGSAIVFDGATQGPLGLYLSTTTADVDGYLTVDLMGTYKLSSVVVEAMGFNNIAFPNTYKVQVSKDGATWKNIGGETGVQLNTFGKYKTINTTEEARFVRVKFEKFNLLQDGNGIYYGGIGELEVFGTLISAPASRSILTPYTNYTAGTSATADAGGNSAWFGFSTGDLDYAFTFKTDVSFTSIGLPGFWSAPGTPLTIEFISNGQTVHTMNYTTAGDGAIILELVKALPRGLYDVIFTINDETIDQGTGYYTKYTVLGYATDGILNNSDYFYFERGNVALDLYSADEGLGFVPLDYHYPERRDFSSDAGDSLSYDQIIVDGQIVAEGNDVVIETKKAGIDGRDGSVSKIALYGWYGNSNQTTAQLGYQINGGRIVWGDFFIDTESAVTSLGANNRRFKIEFDVSNLKGDNNVIWVWAKLENGDEVKLNRYDRTASGDKDREIYVTYNGVPGVNAPTADASMVIFIVAAAAVALAVLKKKVF